MSEEQANLSAEDPSTNPSGMPAPAAPPRGRVRWGIALLVAAVVVGISAAGVWLLTGSSTTSQLAAWVPADSVMYAELRLDLPGDQRQKLGNLLAHFPGFKDQAILDQKLAEVYDRLLKAASNGKHDYSGEIKPWFGGQVAMSVGPLPAVQPGATSAPTARVLMLASVKDAGLASAWLTKTLADSGAQTTSETYAGVQLTVGTSGGERMAAAVKAPVLLVGDETSVKAALDLSGNGGLAADASFKKAVSGALQGDHLGALYVNLKALGDWLVANAGALGAGSGAPAIDPALVGQLPAWVAGSLRAEDAALVGTTASPHASTAGAPASNAHSALLDRIPASALLVIDRHDLGASIVAGLDVLRKSPATRDGLTQIDQAVGLLGGWDALVGWVGETAIVVDREDSGIGGGVVIVPKDRAAADRVVAQVKNALALAGGAGITTSEEQYAGTTITTFSSDAPGIPPGVRVSLAVGDQAVVVGVGDAFVKGVLDAKAGTTLGSSSRFASLLGQVDGQHVGLMYADIAGLRDLIEAQLPAEQRAQYEADVKPYLVGFDGFIATGTVSSDLDRMRAVITVK